MARVLIAVLQNSRLIHLSQFSWRDPDGARYFVAAIIYVGLAYSAGLLGIISSSSLLNILGTVALAHSLVIAGYLLHECAHQSVFISARHNARLGAVLSWMTGACYSGFERVRRKHLRHHVEQADILAWDYRAWLQQRPFMRRLVEWLESLWLPGVEMLLHAAVIVLPFVDSRFRQRRQPVLVILLLRGVFFLCLGWLHPPALIFYGVAYLLFMQVLRFMDVFQHSYLLRFTLTEPQQRSDVDADYEERHTFSNLLSSRWPWLNVLVLNFCYHNMHHHNPLLPWYRLPQAHREIYGDACPQQVLFFDQLCWFHRYRRERVMAPVIDEPAGPVSNSSAIKIGAIKLSGMVGATGVSFITAV